MAEGEAGDGEEDGEFAGLGEDEAAFDGGAGVEAAPFCDGGDEGWGDDEDDGGELEGGPAVGGIRDADECAEGDEEEGLEEIGEGGHLAADEAIEWECGEGEAGGEGTDDEGEADPVCGGGEEEEDGDEPEEEAFLIGLHAFDEPWDGAALGEPGGGDEECGFADGEGDSWEFGIEAGEDDDDGDEEEVLKEEDAGDDAAEGLEEGFAGAELAKDDEGGAGGEAEAEVGGFEWWEAGDAGGGVADDGGEAELDGGDPGDGFSVFDEAAGVEFEAGGEDEEEESEFEEVGGVVFTGGGEGEVCGEEAGEIEEHAGPDEHGEGGDAEDAG